MLNEIIRYFDLYSEQRDYIAKAQASGRKTISPQFWIAAQYLAVVLGVVAKRFTDSLASKTNTPAFSIVFLVVSIIIATAIFPAIYKKSFKSADPSFVQLCGVFAAALGYKTIIDIR